MPPTTDVCSGSYEWMRPRQARLDALLCRDTRVVCVEVGEREERKVSERGVADGEGRDESEKEGVR